MPLTLNVGVSKKRGLPNYGSVGAICNVGVELDAALLSGDQDGFQRQVRNAYAACAQAVNDELDRHGTAIGDQGNENGRSPRNGSPRTDVRKATAPQAGMIRTIANRRGLDLNAELQNRYGVERPEDLSLHEASEMIDAIKPEPVDGGAGR
jgi:hypothetical protein